jgi:RNA polymerase sigma factor (sigma-70 family)
MVSQTLGTLLALPPEARCAEFLAQGRTDLAAARQAIASACGRIPPISVTDLAWAIASTLEPGTEDGPAASVSAYERRWSADTPWDEIWAELNVVRQDSRGGSQTTLLRELAFSVSCEHRKDWRHPESAPLDPDAANDVFDALYARDRQRVGRHVHRRFGLRAGDPDGIADEAWARAFQTYWSAEARRRFAGLSRISTLVSQIAGFIALDVFREQEVARENLSDEDGSSLARLAGLFDDPVNHLISQELHRQILCCARRLPARRQALVHLVWLRQHKAVEAARLLGISEPAVARHLKLAREALRECLGASAGATNRLEPAILLRPAPLTSLAVPRLIGKDE